MNFRLRKQLAEALGQVNRWYCSQFHGYPVEDPNLLWKYFINNGGAVDFARRYDEATGAKNRWYCSEFHGRDIRDPEILWNYYVTHGHSSSNKNNSPTNSSHSEMELCTTR
jgi:hypothetical protein